MAKARREFISGVQEVKQLWETKIGKHMEEIEKSSNHYTPMGVVSSVLVQVVAIGFANFIIWTAKPSSSIFSWHPTLMVLAFMVLMLEAILLFSPWVTVGLASKRNDKIFWHWVLYTCGLVCAYTGLGIITYNKVINGSRHYTSWHGFLGIIVCCALAVQTCSGIILLNSFVLPFKVRKVLLKRLHAFCGTVCFVGSMSVIILSLYSNWATAHISNVYIWYTLVMCPVLILVLVLGQFIKNHFLVMLRRNNY